MKSLFSLLLLLSLISEQGFACDCIMHNDVTYYVKSSQFVFLVTPKDILPEDEPYKIGYRANMITAEVFKGNVQIGQQLEFDSDYSNCSPRYKPGISYLLFAYRKGNKYYVYACTPWGNADSEYTQADIRKIRTYVKHRKGKQLSK